MGIAFEMARAAINPRADLSDEALPGQSSNLLQPVSATSTSATSTFCVRPHRVPVPAVAAPPVLLLLLHRRARRVLRLEPVRLGRRLAMRATHADDSGVRRPVRPNVRAYQPARVQTIRGSSASSTASSGSQSARVHRMTSGLSVLLRPGGWGMGGANRARCGQGQTRQCPFAGRWGATPRWGCLAKVMRRSQKRTPALGEPGSSPDGVEGFGGLGHAHSALGLMWLLTCGVQALRVAALAPPQCVASFSGRLPFRPRGGRVEGRRGAANTLPAPLARCG